MKNLKKNNLVIFLCELFGVFIFTVSLFLVSKDVLLMGDSIFSSLISNSFFFGISITLLAYTVFFSRKHVSPKFKNIIYSFGISYLVLIVTFIVLIFIASFVYDADLSEAPLFAILFLPVIFLYCFIYSLLGLIYNHTFTYTLLYNLIMSLFLLISAYLHWWIFPWFLIFLIFHFFISILKLLRARNMKNI